MKFKFDGVEKILSKIRIISRKFEKTQDVEMRSRLSSPMKVGEPRSNHICQTFHIDHLTEEDKKSVNYEGSDSNKNESICSDDDMVSEGSEDEIDENESQQEVSPRLKQKEIREKLRIFYDAGISAAEVIRKDIHGLIPITIYNHYKLFNEKWPIQERKEVEESI